MLLPGPGMSRQIASATSPILIGGTVQEDARLGYSRESRARRVARPRIIGDINQQRCKKDCLVESSTSLECHVYLRDFDVNCVSSPLPCSKIHPLKPSQGTKRKPTSGPFRPSQNCTQRLRSRSLPVRRSSCSRQQWQ